MAATDVGARNVPPTDDLDDSLFDYDVGDVFRDVETNMDVPTVQKPIAKANGKEDGTGLGLDEEIRVTKKRAPIPKLDVNRVLSPAGIPKLRRVAQERLKFKGKGHEYSDVARLLNVYQLWLDDLYPRAKFADALAIIEKLGHTKQIQTMRREWINEGKSWESMDSLGECIEKPPGEQTSPNLGQHQSWDIKSRERPRTPVAVAEHDDSLYATTPKATQDDRTARRDVDTEDLFLEDSTMAVPILGPKPSSETKEDNFDDDEDALLALDDAW